MFNYWWPIVIIGCVLIAWLLIRSQPWVPRERITRFRETRSRMIKHAPQWIALVIALFAYVGGSLQATIAQEQLDLMRGIQRYRAIHDQAWNVTIAERTGKPIEVQSIELEPHFQLDPSTPIQQGTSFVVPEDRYSYMAGDSPHILIRNANSLICKYQRKYRCEDNWAIFEVYVILERYHERNKVPIELNITDGMS